MYQNWHATHLFSMNNQLIPHISHPPSHIPHPTTHNSHHNSQFTIRNSQLAQATALQTAIEHMRRRKGNAVGLCVWQFNEPWPAVSWSIVEYSGRPKLAYEWLKNLYNPVLVCLEFPIGHCYQPGDAFNAAVWIINDSIETISNYQLTINKMPMGIEVVEVLPNSARRVGQIAVKLPTSSPPHIFVSLNSNGKTLSHNQYHLNWRDLPPAPLSLRFRRWVAEWALW